MRPKVDRANGSRRSSFAVICFLGVQRHSRPSTKERREGKDVPSQQCALRPETATWGQRYSFGGEDDGFVEAVESETNKEECGRTFFGCRCSAVHSSNLAVKDFRRTRIKRQNCRVRHAGGKARRFFRRHPQVRREEWKMSRLCRRR